MKKHYQYKIFNTKNIILWLLLLTTISDALITILIKIKHPVFNESNPIYLKTKSLALFISIKLIIIGLLYLYFELPKWYFKFPDVFRFGTTSILLILIVNQLVASLNGISYYTKVPTEIKPIPQEELEKYYTDTYYNLSINKMEKRRIQTIFYLYTYLFFVFLIWKKIEEENIRENIIC